MKDRNFTVNQRTATSESQATKIFYLGARDMYGPCNLSSPASPKDLHQLHTVLTAVSNSNGLPLSAGNSSYCLLAKLLAMSSSYDGLILPGVNLGYPTCTRLYPARLHQITYHPSEGLSDISGQQRLQHVAIRSIISIPSYDGGPEIPPCGA